MSANDACVAEWNQLVQEWLIDPGHCIAGGLANKHDGAMFAAASSEGDPCEKVYKPDYQEMLPQDDGTDKQTTICEPNTIRDAATNFRAPLGVWIGGQKYKIVRFEKDAEHGDASFDIIFCARPKGGCHLINTPGNLVVVGIYSEAAKQTAASARAGQLEFAAYLAKNNY